MRFMGLVATGALLAIFASAVITFMPERGEETVVSAAPAATATPAPAKAKAKKKAEPRFTAAQRRDPPGRGHDAERARLPARCR